MIKAQVYLYILNIEVFDRLYCITWIKLHFHWEKIQWSTSPH